MFIVQHLKSFPLKWLSEHITSLQTSEVLNDGCVNGLSGRNDDHVIIFEVLEKGKQYGTRSGEYGRYDDTVTFFDLLLTANVHVCERYNKADEHAQNSYTGRCL